jgi:hypothetical protein
MKQVLAEHISQKNVFSVACLFLFLFVFCYCLFFLLHILEAGNSKKSLVGRGAGT